MNSIIVAFCIAFSFCVLAAALAVAFCSVRTRKSIRQYPSFTDLLIYSHLCSENTIALKSGALMRVYAVSAPSMRYSNENAVKTQQENISRALKKLNGNFTVNVDYIRESAMSEKLSLNTQIETADRFISLREQSLINDSTYNVRCYLSLTYRPTLLNLRGSFKKTFFKKRAQSDNESYDRMYLKEFEDALNAVKNALDNGLILKECSFYKKDGCLYHEAVDYIYGCIHGTNQRVRIPSRPFFLDSVLSPSDFYTGTVPMIGSKSVIVVAIEGMPEYSYFDILGRLSRLPF
ncbi:MAG: hypothetical protein ACI4UM_08745, partial [Succinivibrio sp.]